MNETNFKVFIKNVCLIMYIENVKIQQTKTFQSHKVIHKVDLK